MTLDLKSPKSLHKLMPNSTTTLHPENILFSLPIPILLPKLISPSSPTQDTPVPLALAPSQIPEIYLLIPALAAVEEE